ncbi:hypothetical protein LXL04_039808 [Taraxacum kok-saghyz]
MPFRRAPSAKSSFLCEMDGYFGNVSFFRLFGGRLLWNLEFVKLEFINKLYGDNLERIFDSCDILGLIYNLGDTIALQASIYGFTPNHFYVHGVQIMAFEDEILRTHVGARDLLRNLGLTQTPFLLNLTTLLHIDPSIDDVSAWFRTIDCRGHDNGFAFAIECLVSDGRRPANCPPKPEATKTTASLNTTSLGTHKGKNVTKDQNTTKLPPC